MHHSQNQNLQFIDVALASLAATRNYDSDNETACRSITAIYQKIREIKQVFIESGKLDSGVLYALVKEALTLKKVPLDELQERLQRLEALLPSKPKEKAKTQKKLQLFCFPYAGGNAAIYKEWRTYLPESISLIPVEYPRDKINRFADLIDSLKNEVHSQIEGTFAFFGHSFGAIVAYELSQTLVKKYSLSPKSLFLSGCPSPDKVHSTMTTKNLNDGELIKKIEELNGTPKQLLQQKDFVSFFLPQLRRDFEFLDDYIPSPMPTNYQIPLVLYGGKDDRHVSLKDMRGWSHKTQGSSEFFQFEGDHFFLHEPKPMLQNLVTEVQKWHLYDD